MMFLIEGTFGTRKKAMKRTRDLEWKRLLKLRKMKRKMRKKEMSQSRGWDRARE